MASPAHRHPGQRFCLGLMETGVIGDPCQRGPADKVGQLNLLGRYGLLAAADALECRGCKPSAYFLGSGLWVLFESDKVSY